MDWLCIGWPLQKGCNHRLKTEDEAGAEINQFRRGNGDVTPGADSGAGDRGQSAVADLRHAPLDMLREAVIDAAEEGVVDFADVHGGKRGLAGTAADGGLEVRPEGPAEWLAGDAQAYQEVAQHGVVGVQVGEAHIEAGVELAGVEEIVVPAQVVAIEDLGGGVIAEEGE